jgi:twitching motility protein PilT
MNFEQQQANAETQVTLPDLLRKMTDAGGSDLHLTTNSPPQVRVHGHLSVLSGFPVMTPAETKRLAYSVLTDAQKHRFEENLELDFSFGLKGMSRFRANLFNQKARSARFFARFRMKSKPLTIRTAKVVADLCNKPRGWVLVTDRPVRENRRRSPR